MLRKGDEPVRGYRLHQFLGRGAFGEVWRALGPGGTSAALKFIDLNGKQGLKEYRAIQRVKEIRHAHLLPIYAFWMLDQYGDVLDDSELAAWDMEGSVLPAQAKEKMHADPRRPSTLVVAMLLGDKSLHDRLAECTSAGLHGMPVEELLDHMEDAAKGIDFLNSPRHDLGDGPVALQHCDIKPQNLLLVGNSVLVCDFGLARVLGDDQRTKTAMAGSPAYMAPEVIRTRKPSRATDQYALAITYYELRTGELPFDVESYASVLDAHLRGNLDLSRMSPAERVVIVKATSLEPADRYATSLEMTRALRRAVELGDDFVDAQHAPSLASPPGVTRSSVGSIASSLVSPSVASGAPTADAAALASPFATPVAAVLSNAPAAGANKPAIAGTMTPTETMMPLEARGAAAIDNALERMSLRETADTAISTVDSADEDEPVALRPPHTQRNASHGAPSGSSGWLKLLVGMAMVGGGAYAAWQWWPAKSEPSPRGGDAVVVQPKAGHDVKPGVQPNIEPANGVDVRPNGVTDVPRLNNSKEIPANQARINEPVKNTPVVPTVESISATLRFEPADAVVMLDKTPQKLTATGELPIERPPQTQLSMVVRHEGFEELTVTRSIEDLRREPAIRLTPLPFDFAKQGLEFLAKGQPKEAAAALAKAVERDDAPAAIHEALGIARDRLGDHAGAITAFTKALALDGKLVSALRGRAEANRELHEWTKTIDDLTAAANLSPENKPQIAIDLAAAYRGRIENALAGGDLKGTLADCDAALAAVGDVPAARATLLITRAVVRRKGEHFDDAIADFAAAEKLDSSSIEKFKVAWAETLRARARMRSQAGLSDKKPELIESAVTDLTEAIRLDGSDDAYAARGFAYNALQQFEKAIADFDQALRINERNVAALHNRGYAQNSLGQFAKGIEDFTKAIRLKPDEHPTAYNNRGYAYLKLGKFNEAIDDFTKAVLQSKSAPQLSTNGLASAYEGRGQQYAKQGDFDQAVNDYRRALEQAPTLAARLKPQIIAAQLGNATALALKDKLDEALTAANKAVEEAPQDDEAYATRGYVYFKKSQLKQAVADYDQAIKLNAKNARHFFRRGVVHLQMRDANLAVFDLNQAIERDASLVEAYELRAKAYDLRSGKGDADKAKADREAAKKLRAKPAA